MKKKKEFDKSLLILIAIIIVTIVTSFTLYLKVRVDKVSQIIKDRGDLSILITIVEDNKPLLTQVLVMNTVTNKGALIDIPENTGTISIERFSRVDSIYKEHGIDHFRNKVSEILSLDIPFHLVIKNDEFSELVDFLDGLDVFISKSLESTKSDVMIPSGSVVLEGDKVLQYLDIEISKEHKTVKVSRKQKIIQSFLSQIKLFSQKIIKENSLLLFADRIETNLDLSSFNKLFETLGLLQVDRLVLQSIIGESKIVSGEELIFPYNNENLIKVQVKNILVNLNNPEVISDEKLKFSLQVLNGTGTARLASRAGTYLSSFGYSITGVGNAKGSEEHEKTSILIRKGNREAAEKLGELINCDYIYSQSEEGIDDTIDFTIILGKDFDGKRCKN